MVPYHVQLICTPGMVQNAMTQTERINWRIGDLVAKLNHELFLTFGAPDAVVYRATLKDRTVLSAVAKLFESAGWLVETSVTPNDCSILITYNTPGLAKLIAERRQNATTDGAPLAEETSGRNEGDETTVAAAPQPVERIKRDCDLHADYASAVVFTE